MVMIYNVAMLNIMAMFDTMAMLHIMAMFDTMAVIDINGLGRSHALCSCGESMNMLLSLPSMGRATDSGLVPLA